MQVTRCSTQRRTKSETANKNFRICFFHKQKDSKKDLIENSHIDIQRKTISSRVTPIKMKRKEKSLPEKSLKVNISLWAHKGNMEIKPWDTD